MDKERILNFTMMLDKLGRHDLSDFFMSHLEEIHSSEGINPKLASNNLILNKKVKKIGINSLYKEYNIITAGWLDKFKKVWDRKEVPKESPNINWESVLNSMNKSMDSDLRQINQMTRSMGEEWENLRSNHQYLREKAGDISNKYNQVKNSIMSSYPEHKEMLQERYFKHLDDKFSLLNEVMVNEQPSHSLLNDAYNFSKEISQILRRNDNRNLGLDTSNVPAGLEQKKLMEQTDKSLGNPTVTDEETSTSMPLRDREFLNHAWDSYWSFNSNEDRMEYLDYIKNEDPLIGHYLQNWIENYG